MEGDFDFPVLISSTSTTPRAPATTEGYGPQPPPQKRIRALTATIALAKSRSPSPRKRRKGTSSASSSSPIHVTLDSDLFSFNSEEAVSGYPFISPGKGRHSASMSPAKVNSLSAAEPVPPNALVSKLHRFYGDTPSPPISLQTLETASCVFSKSFSMELLTVTKWLLSLSINSSISHVRWKSRSNRG